VIDLQLNGAFGIDAREGRDAVAEIAGRLAERGITTFCPTMVTSPRDAGPAFLQSVAGIPGVAGAHLEGPFFAMAAAGAHDRSLIRPVDQGEIAEWIAAGPPAIVTLAPELPGAIAAIERLVDAGVVVSFGHSHASYAEAARGFDAGGTMVTHVFNAMPPMHHREPGLAGCALDRHDVFVGLIADGVHLHDAVVRMVLRSAPGRVVLVSDAVVEPRLADGTLAGSELLLDEAVERLRLMGIDTTEATTATPARVLERAVGYAHRSRLG
jgi:N-acetylglucosamine-6-phosphate deacetylase